MTARDGLLLVNLGTPDAPTTAAVRRYLREFLSDPRVIDLPAVPRLLLVHGVIAPFRSPRSAEAYRKIWTDDGSPLLLHGRALAAAVAARIAPAPVALAMRYGRPTLADGLAELRAAGCDRVVVLALYPQSADSTTGSTHAAVDAALRRARWSPEVTRVPPFFDHPGFLDAHAAVARDAFSAARPDRVVFSFHGLPERHLRKADPSGAHCLADAGCCEGLRPENAGCYRAQCLATARAIAARLDLRHDGWEVAFQSRLGRTPWIRPYTDETLARLAAARAGDVAVVCPAFVADCLETLEEIGIRAREAYEATGAGRLQLVPSLNAHPAWADAAAAMFRDARGPAVEGPAAG